VALGSLLRQSAIAGEGFLTSKVKARGATQGTVHPVCGSPMA